MAADPWLLDLADRVPPPQLKVNVLLASVHFLLLQGAEHPLAHHYPTVCVTRGLTPADPDPTAAAQAFVDFCRQFEAEVEALLLVRATQTNEVARTLVLGAGLAELRHRGLSTVGLLDAGCSAGLNLFPDAYARRYAAPGGEITTIPSGARVQLSGQVTGAMPPTTLPGIQGRVGLDQFPIEVGDHLERTWLLSCLWPDDVERFERLLLAAEVSEQRAAERQLLRGDLVDDLARAAAQLSSEQPLVLTTSWAAAYLPHDRRPQLTAEVVSIAAHRPLAWLCVESVGVTQHLGLYPSDGPELPPFASVLTLTTFDGAQRSELLAEVHPHGAWITWLA